MPVLAKFYGIVVRMVFAPLLGARFYAIYGDEELVVSIQPVAVIQGDAPLRVRDMVLEWARQHQQELILAWKQCQARHRPRPIAPLY